MARLERIGNFRLVRMGSCSKTRTLKLERSTAACSIVGCCGNSESYVVNSNHLRKFDRPSCAEWTHSAALMLSRCITCTLPTAPICLRPRSDVTRRMQRRLERLFWHAIGWNLLSTRTPGEGMPPVFENMRLEQFGVLSTS